MALVSNKYCPECNTDSTFIEGYDHFHRYINNCCNCMEIEKDKENRKILRESILKRTRRKGKTTNN